MVNIDPDKKTIIMSNELYNYKRQVIEELLKSDELIEALDTNGLEPSELVYTHIFPFGVIKPVQIEAKNFITVEVTMPQVSTVNRFYKDVLLVISVICDISLMKTDYGVPRHDYISAKIAELLGGSSAFGFGELSLISNTESAFSERQAGRTMRFKCSERAQSNLCN